MHKCNVFFVVSSSILGSNCNVCEGEQLLVQLYGVGTIIVWTFAVWVPRVEMETREGNER